MRSSKTKTKGAGYSKVHLVGLREWVRINDNPPKSSSPSSWSRGNPYSSNLGGSDILLCCSGRFRCCRSSSIRYLSSVGDVWRSRSVWAMSCSRSSNRCSWLSLSLRSSWTILLDDFLLAVSARWYVSSRDSRRVGDGGVRSREGGRLSGCIIESGMLRGVDDWVIDLVPKGLRYTRG